MVRRYVLFGLVFVTVLAAVWYVRLGRTQQSLPAQGVETTSNANRMTVSGRLIMSPASRHLGEIERGFQGRDVMVFGNEVNESLDGRRVKVDAVFIGCIGEGDEAVRIWTNAIFVDD